MTQPPNVRIASNKDAAPLFALIWRSHEECGIAPRSDEKIRNMVGIALAKEMLVDPTSGAKLPPPIFGVIDGKDELAAVIGLCVIEHWYSDERYIRGFLTFVHPDYRRTTFAKELLQFGNWWGETMGMPVLYENWSPLQAPAKNRLFARQATLVGGLFMHDLGAQQ